MHQKKETALRENTAVPNNGEKADKTNKDLSKRNSDSSRKISSNNEMKDKKIRQFRDVTVILDDSLIKDVKDWHFIDESNKVVVKSFHGVTISQMKWHVKPTTEQNPKDINLHCGTNDTNDDSEPQNIAEEIAELVKSIEKIVTVT